MGCRVRGCLTEAVMGVNQRLQERGRRKEGGLKTKDPRKTLAGQCPDSFEDRLGVGLVKPESRGKSWDLLGVLKLQAGRGNLSLEGNWGDTRTARGVLETE